MRTTIRTIILALWLVCMHVCAANALPPVAEVGGPYLAIKDSPCFMSGIGSYDPEGMPLVYMWYYGDNHSNQTNHSNTHHTYNTAGTYQLILRVVDSEFYYDTDTTQVIVVIWDSVDPATWGSIKKTF